MRRWRHPISGICGWRHILRPANFVDVAREAIEAGLSSKPAVRHHRLPPKLLPVRVEGYALNSRLQKIIFLPLISSKHHHQPAAGGGSRRGLQAPACQEAPSLEAPTLRICCQPPSKEAENLGATLVWGIPIKGKINAHCRDFGLLGWLEAELYLPMYGRSSEGLYRLSLCLTQYGCLSRLGRNLGMFRVELVLEALLRVMLGLYWGNTGGFI